MKQFLKIFHALHLYCIQFVIGKLTAAFCFVAIKNSNGSVNRQMAPKDIAKSKISSTDQIFDLILNKRKNWKTYFI